MPAELDLGIVYSSAKTKQLDRAVVIKWAVRPEWLDVMHIRVSSWHSSVAEYSKFYRLSLCCN
jgi:hypothetical protein